MTPLMIAQALVTYGPQILPLIQQVMTWIKENKTEVSPEDIQFLIDLSNKQAADYLKEAGGTPTGK